MKKNQERRLHRKNAKIVKEGGTPMQLDRPVKPDTTRRCGHCGQMGHMSASASLSPWYCLTYLLKKPTESVHGGQSSIVDQARRHHRPPPAVHPHLLPTCLILVSTGDPRIPLGTLQLFHRLWRRALQCLLPWMILIMALQHHLVHLVPK
jgi:hypothetical protein